MCVQVVSHSVRVARRGLAGLAVAGLLSVALAGGAGAHHDDDAEAFAGNGGVAVAAANGGADAVGDVNSGGNAGNAIGVGDTGGTVAIDGGEVSSETDIAISADGGAAVADAEGGDENPAVAVDDE